MGTEDRIALSEAYGGDWQDSPPAVWQRLARSAQLYPDKLALACLHQPADLYGLRSLTDDHLQWSYATLSSAADTCRKGLEAYGLSVGSSVVTILDNVAEFPLSFWAAHKLGSPFVPLNPRNLANKSEARHTLTIACAGAVVVGSPDLANAFDTLAYDGGSGLLKVVAGEAPPSGWISFSSVLASGKEATAESTITHPERTATNNFTRDSLLRSDGKPVTILFTSGTTSLPKGCPHTDQTLNAFMKNLALGGCSPDHTFCSVLPNNHAMGYFTYSTFSAKEAQWSTHLPRSTPEKWQKPKQYTTAHTRALCQLRSTA